MDWTPYEQRLRHAEVHLDSFVTNCEMEKDDIIIEQQAQNALEHGMKALLHAHGAPYRGVHEIGELLGNSRHFDPELGQFRLSIQPDVYSEYEGEKEYNERTQPTLTSFTDFQERTARDVEFIIERARQVRARRDQQG